MLPGLNFSSFHCRTYPDDSITTQLNLRWENLGAAQFLNLKGADELADLKIAEDSSKRTQYSRTYASTDKTFKITLFTEEAPSGSANDLPTGTSLIPAIDTLDTVLEF